MPIYKQSKKLLENQEYGNLYIHFNIIFPKFIEPQNKDTIIDLLDKNTN